MDLHPSLSFPFLEAFLLQSFKPSDFQENHALSLPKPPASPLNQEGPAQAEVNTSSLESVSLNLGQRRGKTWTHAEDELLIEAVKKNDARNWKAIAKNLPGRTYSQCAQRWRRMQPHKTRSPWSKHEDRMVLDLVSRYGHNWALIAQQVEGRTGKQIRERYINKLNPGINRNKFSEEEDLRIIKLWKQIGPKWQQISEELKGRTENMIKNRFYSHLKKKYLTDINDPTETMEKPDFSVHPLEDFNEKTDQVEKEVKFGSREAMEAFNLGNGYEEEDLRSVQSHYEFLKRKRELLQKSLLCLSEKINNYEMSNMSNLYPEQ